MAIKHHVVTLSPDQYPEWNKFVDESPQGDIFCYSWWLDAVTKSRFKIFAAIRNDKIVAGMPAPYDLSGKINEPYLTRTLGILYSRPEGLSELKQFSYQRKLMNSLVGCIPQSCFVQMCMHHSVNDWLPLKWKGYKQTTRYTYLIYYAKRSTPELFRNLSQSTKYNIRKAEKNEINVTLSEDPSLLYHYTTLSFKRQGLELRFSLRDFLNLDNSINKNGHRLIFRASDRNGRTHAMNYVIYNEKSAYSLLSGSDPDIRYQGGHTLNLWEAIKYFSNKVQYFNMGGSNIRDIEEHRRGFGGVLTPFFHIYNEHTIDNGILYHLKELSFHLNAIARKSVKRILFG